MSVISGLSKGDFKTASDGLLELSEDRLRSIMRTEPITDVYHVEQTPFASDIKLRFTLRKIINPYNVSERNFIKKYRLNKEAFDFLEEIIMQRTNLRATRRVSLKHKLLCALSFYAHGSYQQVVGDAKNLGQTTVSKYVQEVTNALSAPAVVEELIKFPTTRAERDIVRAKGKFASVRKIRHLVSGEEYAAKFIRKRRRAADTSREIYHEVAVLALCGGCTRVVRLHEVYETRSEVAIVLELCAGGELQHLLDEEERLSEGAARRALRHVLEGLAHLHARRVAHLDLKPQNLLLTAGGEELLICDFGISRAIQSGAHVREILGTRDYVAPEILSYEPLSLAADMWSVGVLAYVLLSGYSPFAGDTKQETYLNIAQCQLSFPKDLFRGVSQRAIQFIRDTLVVDPKGRLTVEECLEHPWLKDESDIPPAIVGVGFDNTELASDDEDAEEVNGKVNGNVNGVNGTLMINGVNGHNGHNGHVNGCNGVTFNGCNGANGTHEEEEKEEHPQSRAQSPAREGDADAEERDKPLKHAHARDVSPPFPDAPSTPKVSRKSHPHPPSVLALCKKFQPDYEKPATLGECPAACCHGNQPAACLRLRNQRPPPDRALIC